MIFGSIRLLVLVWFVLFVFVGFGGVVICVKFLGFRGGVLFVVFGLRFFLGWVL